MSQETQKFLQAEQSAQDLLATLSSLQQEAVSYKTGTSELDAVREKLIKLIEAIHLIAVDTHEVVKLVKGIGGPEIIKSINTLNKKIEEESQNNEERFSKIKLFTMISISVAVLSCLGVAVILFR
jgi:hypothetical protein